MTIDTPELLARLSRTIRHEVAPDVAEEYTKTQAHMASVILDKLAKQLALGPAHAAAEQSDLAQLHRDLTGPLATAPPAVTRAAEAAAAQGTVAALGPLIEALYRWGLDTEQASDALSRIRAVLRHDIDRRMEIAG